MDPDPETETETETEGIAQALPEHLLEQCLSSACVVLEQRYEHVLTLVPVVL